MQLVDEPPDDTLEAALVTGERQPCSDGPWRTFRLLSDLAKPAPVWYSEEDLASICSQAEWLGHTVLALARSLRTEAAVSMRGRLAGVTF